MLDPLILIVQRVKPGLPFPQNAPLPYTLQKWQISRSRKLTDSCSVDSFYRFIFSPLHAKAIVL
ncbi:hypothetical protein EH198_05795 [Paenibacillus rhizophilus]|uniref:Uncharacterized protein n=1 Tax=Paenibacillus rhizophilus TaxID=1850366 RepID=A0A3N9P9S1_9BACL|nr:hypothetical protein EH198_05795 [Paenibacillus rhizophilus]